MKDKGGKLRLMYEANPMALIVEQAGGAAPLAASASSTSSRQAAPARAGHPGLPKRCSPNEVERVPTTAWSVRATADTPKW
jgi:hypothetical protein